MASKLEQQLTRLNKLKEKVCCYLAIKEILAERQKDTKNPELAEIATEVSNELTTFIDRMIQKLEDGEDLDQTDTTLIQKIVGPNLVQNPPDLEENSIKKLDKKDKMQFAIANRHLDGKEVIISTKNGEVLGTVVGLDAPNVIVETVTGFRATIALDKIRER
jgi:hypothetical protein